MQEKKIIQGSLTDDVPYWRRYRNIKAQIDIETWRLFKSKTALEGYTIADALKRFIFYYVGSGKKLDEILPLEEIKEVSNVKP